MWKQKIMKETGRRRITGIPGHSLFGSVSQLETDAPPFLALRAATGFVAI
jgi:hypothetical protein